MKQNLCMVAALALFLFAAGIIETHTGWSLILLAGVGALIAVGRLEKKRVTCEDIERRYSK